MNFDITFGYPTWLLTICIISACGYATLLYYKNNEGLGKKTSIVLAATRFILIFTIALLLLAPMIERLVRTEEEPMILFVQDNTASVIFGTDTTYYLNDYFDEVNCFTEELKKEYDVRTYTFGESFKRNDTFSFEEKYTDISAIFDGLQTSYSNRNLGAVIIASDGIYNRGTHPVYASTANNFPVYTIALGDTIPHKDVILKDVLHNQITYKGNKFPLQVHIEARECMGENSTLIISKNEQVLFSKDINFTSSHHFETVDLTLEADEAGMQRYHVALSPVENEISIANNSKDIFIEVLDSRQKILILSNTPHPDIGAIKQSLENNENYEVSSYSIDEFDSNVEQYNLAILHQLPSFAHTQHKVIRQLDKNKIPRLFIIGSQTNLQAFNNLQTGLRITPRSERFNESIGILYHNFALFSTSEDFKEVLNLLPPLFSIFANYETDGSARIFLYQKIGNVITDYPLILFTETEDTKTGIITAEGIWRWRLHNYLHKQNHDAFNELISKTAQYLSVLDDRSRLRIFSENIFYENEAITFSAEVYNQSYELINEPELSLTIYRDDGVDYPFVFSRTSNAYSLDAGTFPVGDYTYEGRVTIGDESFTRKGEFSIIPLNLEKLQTIANHQLLFRLASENDGKMIYPGQWNELLEELNNREDIRPVIYTQKQFEDAISIRSIFFLILLLLSIEWFVRKRSGVY